MYFIMIRKDRLKVYLNGCSGIEKPVDMHGNEISIGDKLSWDYGCPYYKDKIVPWMKEPIFIVKAHRNGKGLCAEGINKELYLHDFRFKYCERIVGDEVNT